MPVKIFFCYAHEDEQLLNKLKSHLIPLQRQGLIEVWHDRDISAGADWEQQIKDHLDASQIILLLISPDFMNSDYCYSIEMQRALDRHKREEAHVIPVILRPIYWRGSLFGQLQALPTDAKPVVDRYWHNLDEAFFDVAEGISKVVEEITTKSTPPTNLPDKVQKTKEQWVEEGIRLRNLKRYEEALAAYEQVLLLDPNNAETFFKKGRDLFELKRYEEALVAYEQALLLDPNAYHYLIKGIILRRLKSYREALGACEQSLRLDPYNAYAYDTKGAILNELKRYEEALTACEQALRFYSDLPEAYYNKGDALIGLNRKEEAQEAYEKARQLGYSG